MYRDSKTKSIWEADFPPVTFDSVFHSHEIFDALVVGAGITGLTTALFLQEAGKKCIIAEAENIGFGTSSGTTAHLNTLLDTPYYLIKKKFDLDAARLMKHGATQAISIVKGNATNYSIACEFTLCNGFLYAEDEKQTEQLETIRQGMEEVGINATYSEYIPIPMPFQKALLVPHQARFHPVKYLYGLAKAFSDAGGVLLEHAAIDKDKVKEEDEYIQAIVNGKEIKAKNIVYATHIPLGVNLLHFECIANRSYAMAVQLDKDEHYPEDLVYDMKDPYNYFRTAFIHDQKYLVAGGFDHATGHDVNEKKSFLELEAYLRTYFSIKSVDYKWSSQYYEPADGLPYIGRLPGAGEHSFVATGFSGNGMTLGSLSGKIISDLIITGESPFKELLSPSRMKPVASFENFITHNAEVVKHFITDRIAADKIKELVEISNGEGRIVNYEGTKIALYKEESGRLTALSPVCTHAKCIVQWNDAEKSWDCPCHGSRFNVEGKVLNGPADQPLKKIELKTL